jgi:diguanylate cyclase (GGDEF)-like protein
MALILGVGGAMCLFAAAFPVSPHAPVDLAAVVGVLLVAAAAVVLWRGTALPPTALQALAATGTLVNSLLVASSTTNYGAALNSFAYLWIAIYAGQFFEHRAVRAQCALVAVASGVALTISGIPGLLTAWVLVAGSAALAGETLAHLNARLRTQLATDPLTGMLNRAGLMSAVRQILASASRSGTPVGVALIDLDEFKQVNDSRGHAAGDELLAELGRVWPGRLRATEVLARLGGDEFALVLPGADAVGAGDALRRLRAAPSLRWSAGVVEWRPGEAFERTLARADEELYRAKRRAREEGESRQGRAAGATDSGGGKRVLLA